MPNYVVSAPLKATSATSKSSNASLSRETSPSSLATERRRRGETSCAECRRLKMRCDKSIPCKPCIRRGCAHLCPNGTNVTADGPKFILAATNHLHEDISTLRDRIRILEGALGSLHRRRTGRTHPLLAAPRDDDWEDESLASHTTSSPKSQQVFRDSDTLAAGKDGSARLFGCVPDALSHVMLMMDHDPKRLLVGAPFPDFDIELTRRLRHGFIVPTPPSDIPRIIHLLRIQLPDRVTCETLIDIALAEVGTSLIAFTPEYIDNTILPLALDGEGPRALHSLISLFALLAIGALLAVPGPGEAPEVYRYARFSGSAVGVSVPASVNTVELIEGMYVRTVLEFMRQGYMEEVGRSVFAMACKMCYEIGLHVDASKWDVFTDEEVCHRRAVFWMLFKTDAWESLAVGRPPVIALHMVNVELPDTLTKPTDPLEKLTRTFANATLINAEIILATQSLSPPSYTQILRLDERVITRHPKPTQFHPSASPPPSMIRIFLHRAFFARALTDHPGDLLKSEYATSVLATIRGAHETLSWLAELLKVRPQITSRLWYVWNMGYVAATVYITLLERAPRCPQAEDAQFQVEHAIFLFKVGAKYGSGRAKHAVAVLSTRFEKIAKAANLHLSDPDPSRLRTESPWMLKSTNDFVFPPDQDPPTLTLPSVPLMVQHSLKRTTSLPSIADNTAFSSAQPSLFSATDDSFYPSYLKYPTRQQKIRTKTSKPLEELDLGPFVSISQRRTRPLGPELPYYYSANNAALWDGAGWESMQHATKTNAALEVTVDEIPPQRTSLAGEWNMINFGDS